VSIFANDLFNRIVAKAYSSLELLFRGFVSAWNSLPSVTINSKYVSAFKRSLESSDLSLFKIGLLVLLSIYYFLCTFVYTFTCYYCNWCHISGSLPCDKQRVCIVYFTTACHCFYCISFELLNKINKL